MNIEVIAEINELIPSWSQLPICKQYSKYILEYNITQYKKIVDNIKHMPNWKPTPNAISPKYQYEVLYQTSNEFYDKLNTTNDFSFHLSARLPKQTSFKSEKEMIEYWRRVRLVPDIVLTINSVNRSELDRYNVTIQGELVEKMPQCEIIQNSGKVIICIHYTSIIKLSKNITNSTNIQVLSMLSNCMTNMPNLIEMKLLRILDISNEKIKTFDFTKLPVDISRVCVIECYNLYKIIDNIPIMTNLKTLEISECHLKKLPDSFTNIRNLENICIKNNDIKEYPTVLRNMIKLVQINISNNKLKKIFQYDILNLIHLTVIDISNNKIEKSMAKRFSDETNDIFPHATVIYDN